MRNLIKVILGEGKAPRSAAHGIAWNYAGYIYQIAINFGLTAYIVRHIAVADYGLFLLVMSLSTTLYLLDIGISYFLIQSYIVAFEHAETDRLNDLISTAFLALAALGFIGLLIFCAFAAFLPGPLNIPHRYLHEAGSIFVIAALIMQVNLPSVAIEQVYQASHRFDRINQVQFLTSTVNMICCLIVIGAGFHIVALALVQLAVALLQLLLYILALPSSVPLARLSLARFRWNLLKRLMSLSKWAFLHNLSMYLFDFFTWGILASIGSMREVALFGIAMKMPRQLRSLVDRGANVLLPILSRNSVQADHVTLQRTFLKAQKLIVGGILPFVVLGCFFAKPLLQVWVGSRYSDATIAMQWLLLSSLAHAVGYPSDELLYACGQARKSTIISFSSGIMSIAGALLLIPHYGAAGLAAAMAIPLLFSNCAWFPAEASKVCLIPFRTLLKIVLGDLSWPLLVLAAEITFIWMFWRFLSPLWLVILALVSGCGYLLLWGVHTAFPLWRNQTEISTYK